MTDKDVEQMFTVYAKMKQTNPDDAEFFLRRVKNHFYGDTFGGVRTPEELTRIRVLFENRLDDNHKCCHCGACCDRVLMLTSKEIEGINRFLRKNPRVKKYINKINRGHPHRKCPFLDHTKESEKCMIYGQPFFPIICGSYLCDEDAINPEKFVARYIRNGLPKSVDLWHLVGDPVDITSAWEFKDELSLKYGIRLGPYIMLYPEQLIEKMEEFRSEIENSIK